MSTLLWATALYICTRKVLGASFKSKEITMKQLIAIIATVAAATAFAADAPKATPAPAATAPAASAPVAKKDEPKKADTKSAPAADKKAEAAKK